MLTRRQKEVLDFVSRHIDKHGVAPTLHEIGRHLKLSSVATVHKHCGSSKRRARCAGSRTRAARCRGAQGRGHGGRSSRCSAPVRPAPPIEPIETPGTIAIPEELLGRGETFALRVKGDSMIDDGIHDGDVVIVESRRDAENGATVVALVEGEATVKRFYRKRGRIHLVPANERLEPIVAREEDVELRGVVVGLVRVTAMSEPFALYVHVPWCRRVCPVLRLQRLRRPHPPRPPTPTRSCASSRHGPRAPPFAGRRVGTLYVGGGTPSLFSAGAIDRIVAAARARSAWPTARRSRSKRTPAPSTSGRCARYRAAGVNRLSLGVQSFTPRLLERLGRDHGPEDSEGRRRRGAAPPASTT
jgi:repressor LexA